MTELYVTTCVRFTKAEVEKLEQLSKALNTKRNRVLSALIDAAQVVSTPVINVELPMDSSGVEQCHV